MKSFHKPWVVHCADVINGGWLEVPEVDQLQKAGISFQALVILNMSSYSTVPSQRITE